MKGENTFGFSGCSLESQGESYSSLFFCWVELFWVSDFSELLLLIFSSSEKSSNSEIKEQKIRYNAFDQLKKKNASRRMNQTKGTDQASNQKNSKQQQWIYRKKFCWNNRQKIAVLYPWFKTCGNGKGRFVFFSFLPIPLMAVSVLWLKWPSKKSMTKQQQKQ